MDNSIPASGLRRILGRCHAFLGVDVWAVVGAAICVRMWALRGGGRRVARHRCGERARRYLWSVGVTRFV
ncbi:MAG: hypothetical protein HG464_003120 [Bacteroidia bacterium]|nr:hypothetical protein [Bacteroidia bacterium]